MAAKGKIQFTFPALSALFALTLTACGDSSTDIGDLQSAENAVVAGNVQTAELSLKPINLAEAYSPLSGASKPVPVCPWLSDASANAAVVNVMTSEPMVRRAVTPDECKWNVNMGFSLSIRTVPLSEAADPSTVTYNMDSPPVLEPQDGPGNNAVAILDATWNADKPRPFAFVFNADSRQFKITTTGVKTSIEQLRAVADEIAQALPAATPILTASADPTLNPCVYDGATIATLFGGTAGEALTPKPYLPGSSCKYSGIIGEAGIELTFSFSGDVLSPPNIMDPDYALTDKFSADVYVKDMASIAGYGSTARAYQIARPSGQVRIDLLVGAKTFPDDVAALLVNNLIARTN